MPVDRDAREDGHAGFDAVCAALLQMFSQVIKGGRDGRVGTTFLLVWPVQVVGQFFHDVLTGFQDSRGVTGLVESYDLPHEICDGWHGTPWM